MRSGRCGAAALQVAAQGRLPLGAQGITEVRDAWTVADALRDAVARTGGDPYAEGLELSVELGLAGGVGDAPDGDRQDALRLVGQLSDRARAGGGGRRAAPAAVVAGVHELCLRGRIGA